MDERMCIPQKSSEDSTNIFAIVDFPTPFLPASPTNIMISNRQMLTMNASKSVNFFIILFLGYFNRVKLFLKCVIINTIKEMKSVTQYIEHIADNIENENNENIVANPITQKSVEIVRNFLSQKKRVLYGGKAINDSLPKKYRFYDEKSTIPDYDFYTPEPQKDAVELANRLYAAKIPFVEVKTSQIHESTFKVYANFIAIADCTEMPLDIYNMVVKEATEDPEGVLLASPDWLRMNMYLELARPKGDVSRWSKIAERLALLNKYKPLVLPKKCSRYPIITYVKLMNNHPCYKYLRKVSYLAAKYISQHNLLMVGATSLNVYIHSVRAKNTKITIDEVDAFNVSDYDVLSLNAKQHADKFRNYLLINGIKNVKIVQHHPGITELLPMRYRVTYECSGGQKQKQKAGIDFYENDNCWSYHTVNLPQLKLPVRIASVETLITFLFKWMYFIRDKLGRQIMRGKVYCIIDFLLHNQNKMTNPIFKPTARNCYGDPVTLNSIRADNWKKDKNKRPFRYRPEEGFIKYKKITTQKKRKTSRAPTKIANIGPFVLAIK